MSDSVDDYDPLREKLEALEREVAARKMRERQAACKHEWHTLTTIGAPDTRVCALCGKYEEQP